MKSDKNSAHEASVLIVSADQSFTDRIVGGLSKAHRRGARIDSASPQELNGHAADRFGKSNVVILEAINRDAASREMVVTLLKRKNPATTFLALADDDVTIAEARYLREAGVDEVLPASVTPEELQAAIDASVERHRAPVAGPAAGTAAVLAIAKARGGIGSTTVAVNLARQLSHRPGWRGRGEPRRVLILDLDIQFGDTNVLLDFEDNGALTRMLTNGSVPEFEDLKFQIQHHSSGIDLLGAPSEMVPLDAPSVGLVSDLLHRLQPHYDYIVVDLPHALVDWIGPVLDLATRVFVVTDTSVQGVRQARRLRDIFREVRIGLPIDYIVNRAHAPLLRSAEVTDAEKVLETKLRHWLPDAPRETRRSADMGRPLVDLFPRAKLTKAYRRLADSALQATPQTRTI